MYIPKDRFFIVPTNVNYNYSILIKNLQELKKVYPFIFVDNIGYSVMGKAIPYVKIGNGQNAVFYNARNTRK